MPISPSKPCSYPGCGNLVKKGRYCSVHEHLDVNTKFRNKRSISHKWYYTKYWKQVRTRKLKGNPLCEYCQGKKRITAADTVDHVIPFLTGKTEDQQWRLFSDWDNLKSSCQSCHNSKTSKENKP